MIANNNPKVSIIIPVYNVKQYLEESLDSVINQTYKNLEILVVDDGSNDGSEIICEEYAKKDNRIKLIRRVNGGLSAARNTGLDNMTGNYVAFLDSDDVLLPEAIKKSVDAMLSKDIDGVIFKYITGNTKNINSTKFPCIKTGMYSKEEALIAVADRRINASVWNKLTKREIWDNLRFPEGYVFEDRHIIFPIISKMKNIYIMDDVLILYRSRTESITATDSVKNIEDLFKSWAVFENYIEIHTPEFFKAEQLKITRQKNFTDLTLHYAKILSANIFKKSEVLNIMKHHIKNYEKNINIKHCDLKTRLVYYMIFHHPIILSVFYQPAVIIYKKIKRILETIKH